MKVRKEIFYIFFSFSFINVNFVINSSECATYNNDNYLTNSFLPGYEIKSNNPFEVSENIQRNPLKPSLINRHKKDKKIKKMRENMNDIMKKIFKKKKIKKYKNISNIVPVTFDVNTLAYYMGNDINHDDYNEHKENKNNGSFSKSIKEKKSLYNDEKINNRPGIEYSHCNRYSIYGNVNDYDYNKEGVVGGYDNMKGGVSRYDNNDGAVGGGYNNEGAVGGGYNNEGAVGGGYNNEGAVGGGYNIEGAVGVDYNNEGAVGSDYNNEGGVGGGEHLLVYGDYNKKILPKRVLSKSNIVNEDNNKIDINDIKYTSKTGKILKKEDNDKEIKNKYIYELKNIHKQLYCVTRSCANTWAYLGNMLESTYSDGQDDVFVFDDYFSIALRQINLVFKEIDGIDSNTNFGKIMEIKKNINNILLPSFDIIDIIFGHSLKTIEQTTYILNENLNINIYGNDYNNVENPFYDENIKIKNDLLFHLYNDIGNLLSNQLALARVNIYNPTRIYSEQFLNISKILERSIPKVSLHISQSISLLRKFEKKNKNKKYINSGNNQDDNKYNIESYVDSYIYSLNSLSGLSESILATNNDLNKIYKNDNIDIYNFMNKYSYTNIEKNDYNNGIINNNKKNFQNIKIEINKKIALDPYDSDLDDDVFISEADTSAEKVNYFDNDLDITDINIVYDNDVFENRIIKRDIYTTIYISKYVNDYIFALQKNFENIYINYYNKGYTTDELKPIEDSIKKLGNMKKNIILRLRHLFNKYINPENPNYINVEQLTNDYFYNEYQSVKSNIETAVDICASELKQYINDDKFGKTVSENIIFLLYFSESVDYDKYEKSELDIVYKLRHARDYIRTILTISSPYISKEVEIYFENFSLKNPSKTLVEKTFNKLEDVNNQLGIYLQK